MQTKEKNQIIRQLDTHIANKLILLLETEIQYTDEVLKIISIYQERLFSLNKLDKRNRNFYRTYCFDNTKKVILNSKLPEQIKNYLIRIIRDIYKK